MSFVEDFVRAWGEGGRDAAFALIKGLFEDPGNQQKKGKPTDFLHDDDDESTDTEEPAKGFAEFVDGFKPKRSPEKTAEWILERIAESRAEGDWDDKHAFQPLNLLELVLGYYERLDVQVKSLHAAGDKRVEQYGLYHEIIGDRDTKEEYHFTYFINHDDQLTLRYGEEVVPGKVAHHLAKLAIYGGYLRDVVAALVASEAFAKLPKALPLRFVFGTHEYSKLGLEVELAPPLDEASLAGHPLRDAYLEAARVREVTRDDRFLYALERAARDDAAREQLAELVRGVPEYIAALHAIGEDQLLRTKVLDAHGRKSRVIKEAVKGDARLEELFGERPLSDPESLLGRVRAIGPGFLTVVGALAKAGAADLALSLAKARFELPPPSWQAHGDEAERTAKNHLETFASLLALAPEELQPYHDAAVARLSESDDPMVTLTLLEAQVPQEAIDAFDEMSADGDDDEDEDDDGDEGEDDGDDDDDEDDDDDDDDDEDDDDDHEEESDAGLFDDLTPGAKVLAREGSQRYIDAVIATIACREHGRLRDETLARLKALGPRARAAEPHLRAFLTELCADGYNHDSEVAPVAEVLWRIGAEDVPEEVHKAHRSNQFYMEEFYGKWAKAAPTRALKRLLAVLRAEPASAASPATWEQGLYDSAPGFELFRKAIADAPERDAWIDGLGRALGGGANDVVLRFARDWARVASSEDQRLTLRLLEPIEARLTDEEVGVGDSGRRRSDRQRLRHARVHRLAEWLDRDAAEADAELARLYRIYPDDATVLFLDTMRTARREGPRAAGTRTLDHARRLSVDDIVYRKAVFLYTRTPSERWEDVEIGHAFALHDLAEKKLRKGAWTDGKLDRNPWELDRDPLYEALENKVSELSAEELDRTLAGYKRALDVLDRGDADLAAALDRDNFELSWLVAKRLATQAPPDLGKLVEVYTWFADDKERRRALNELVWPLAGAKEALLANPVFREHLPDFIARYPLPSDQLAREIFAHFSARGEDAHVIAVADKLDTRLVLAVALSILNAYVRTARYEDAITLLRRVLGETKPKAPEWVLVAANLAAMQAQAGKLDDAEGTLDDLFSRDWSRFDHSTEPRKDHFSLFGGDLDAEYTKVFRRYWAQAKFNAGCIHGLRGRAPEAAEALREAIRYAPDAYPAEKLLAEKDLASIVDAPEMEQLLADLGGDL